VLDLLPSYWSCQQLMLQLLLCAPPQPLRSRHCPLGLLLAFPAGPEQLKKKQQQVEFEQQVLSS